MSNEAVDATPAAEPAARPELDRAQELENLKSVGTLHFVLVLTALTLWGAADAWAVSSGWALAWIVAVANAIVAGKVIGSTLHEWGHYAGARLAGAYATVKEKPFKYFFMFDFPFEHNDRRQFVWMSWGGIGVPWLLVVLVALAVPIDNASRAALIATLVTVAIQASLFEVPIVMRAAGGGEPQAELIKAVQAGTLKSSRNWGIGAGVLVWLAL